MRPTFLVIGAAKCGTTTLWELLRQHPEVFLTERKELHYFSFDRNHARGPAWYERWFEGAGDAVARGECSTTYTVRRVFPRAAERIAAYDAGLRLIYLVRDPLPRIESLWRQLLRFGPAPPIRAVGLGNVPDELWVDSSFERAVRRQEAVLVDSTNYRQELEVHRRHFPDERILVLFFEDLRRDPVGVAQRAFRFLEVDPTFAPRVRERPSNPYDAYPVHRPLLRRLWSSRATRAACASALDLLPPRLCERLSVRFLRVPLAERPRWSTATREWVLERLRPDLERFRAEHGAPADGWSSF